MDCNGCGACSGCCSQDDTDLMPLDEMVGTMPHPDERNWRGIN